MKQSEVIMMCGVSGAGKTTFAKEKELEGYVRLSIDEQVWKDYGRYGIDYPKDLYEEYSEIAEDKLKKRMLDLIHEGKNIVVDFSFWSKSRREEYKSLIENNNGTVKLIYLRASLELLQSRLKERNKRFDANAAYKITVEILDRYYHGFEEPINEGEIVIEQK